MPLDPPDALDLRGYYARLSGTTQTFLVSAMLWDYLNHASIDENVASAQFQAEVARLENLGFAPLPHQFSKETVAARTDTIRELSLHLTHGCNLACTYCNVQQGTYGDAFSRMDVYTARAAIDFLLTSAEADDASPLRLVLYGGEPLLNWPTLEAAVTMMRDAAPGSDITLVTNGTLLNAERTEFLAAHDVFAIISIDGPKAVQDHNRPLINGGSTYDQALNGLELLKKAGARFHVRGTWVPGKAAYEETLAHLIKIAGDYRRVTLGLCFEAALGDKIADYNQSLTALFEAAKTDITRLPSVVFDVLNRILRPGLESRTGCGAGRDGVSVTPQGDIYPCQVSVSRKTYRLGNVHDGLSADGLKNQKQFLSISSAVCGTCWARAYCPGPCPYAVPIPDNWSFCQTMKHQIWEVFGFCGATPASDLLRIYMPPTLPSGKTMSSAPARGAALRDIVWAANQHIRPLAIGPHSGMVSGRTCL